MTAALASDALDRARAHGRQASAPHVGGRAWLVGLAVCTGAGCWAAPHAQTTRLTAPAPLPAAQLRLALTPRAAMVYEPGQGTAPLPLAHRAGAETPPSLGLEFRAPPSQQGPRGLLRVQLSGDAALQFRPRRGGLAVSYRAQF